MRLNSFFRRIVGLLFAFLSFASHSQVDLNQKKKADAALEKKDFATALIDFRQLLAQNPKNAELNLKYAICVFHTDDIKKATKYFDYALKQGNSTAEAYFYRGRIYQHEYNFPKAIEFFEKYKTIRDKKQEDLDADTYIRYCKNAQQLISQPGSLKIYARSLSLGTDFFNRYTFTNKKYNFYEVDDAFLKDNEKKKFKPTYIFLRGMKYRIFASYSSESTGGKDLFMQKKDAANEWGKPIKLCKEINTLYDEDFPYFDEEEGVLYFSSKGHNSMGGYDIFKTTFNLESNTCSTPENLNFPYCSPDDDFFFIPDPGTNFAFFATNRNGNAAKVEVFKVEKAAKKVELIFIAGQFQDKIETQNKAMEVTVKNLQSNEVFGPVYSSENGNYLIGIPSAGRYEFTVKVEGTLKTFTEQVEIPAPMKFKHLQQLMIYEMQNSKEELSIVTSEGEEQLTQELAIQQLSQIGHLDVNAESLVARVETNTSEENITQHQPKASTKEKVAAQLETMLNKEIDLEDDLKLQAAVNEKILSNEQKINALRKQIDDLKSETTKNDVVLNQIRQKEIELQKVVRETIVLETLQLKTAQVQKSKDDLEFVNQYNKGLSEMQYKDNEEDIVEFLESNATRTTEISAQTYFSPEQKFINEEKKISDRKIELSENLKVSKQEISKLTSEIESLEKSKADQNKKEREETDSKITQKKRSLGLLKEQRENDSLQMNEIQLYEQAFNESKTLIAQLNQRVDEIPVEAIADLETVIVDKMDINALLALSNEVKNELIGQTQTVQEPTKSVDKTSTLNADIAKINQEIDTKIVAHQQIADKKQQLEKLLAEENTRMTKLENLRSAQHTDTEKEQLDEAIQLSESRKRDLNDQLSSLSQPVKTSNLAADIAKINQETDTKIVTHQKITDKKQQLEKLLAEENTRLTKLENLRSAQHSDSEKEQLDEAIQLSESRKRDLNEQLSSLSQPVKTSTLAADIAKINQETDAKIVTNQQVTDKKQQLEKMLAEENTRLTKLENLRSAQNSDTEKEQLDEAIQLSEKKKLDLTEQLNAIKPTNTVTKASDLVAKIEKIHNESTDKIMIYNQIPDEFTRTKNLLSQEEIRLSKFKNLQASAKEDSDKQLVAKEIEASEARKKELEDRLKSMTAVASDSEMDALRAKVQKINDETQRKLDAHADKVDEKSKLNSFIEEENQRISKLSKLESAEHSQDQKDLLETEIAEAKSRKQKWQNQLAALNTAVEVQPTIVQRSRDNISGELEVEQNERNIAEKQAYTASQEQMENRIQVNKSYENTLKSAIEATKDPKEKKRLQTELTTLQTEQKSLAQNAFLTEKKAVVAQAYPTLKLENQEDVQAHLRSLELQENQLKSKIASTKNEEEKKQLSKNVQSIQAEKDTWVKRLESANATPKPELKRNFEPQIDTAAIAKMEFSNEFSAYLSERNQQVEAYRKIDSLEQLIQQEKIKLSADMANDNQTEISQSQRNYLTKMQTLRDEQIKAETDYWVHTQNVENVSNAAKYEWMLANNKVPKRKVEVQGTELSSSASETAFTVLPANALPESPVFPIDIQGPGGLIYRVQVGAFRKQVPAEFFREFTPVTGERLTNGLTCYMAGYFNHLDKAQTAKLQVRDFGYKDAFIVAYCDGKRITFTEAKELEANGKCVPLSDENLLIALRNQQQLNLANTPQNRVDSTETKPVDLTYNQAPGAVDAIAIEGIKSLFFTVQVGVFNKPVTPEILPGINELYTFKVGNILRYSSGKFKSVDDAKTRRTEVVGKGIKDAFIVAYYKGKRLTVAEANQLIARQGNGILEEGNGTISQSTNLGTPSSGTTVREEIEEMKVVNLPAPKTNLFRLELAVSEEKITDELEKWNQFGIFQYNANTGRIYSGLLTEKDLNVMPIEVLSAFDRVEVKEPKMKPIVFIIADMETWNGGFADWLLRSDIGYKSEGKNIKFYPKTKDEVQQLKDIANEFNIEWNE